MLLHMMVVANNHNLIIPICFFAWTMLNAPHPIMAMISMQRPS
jgi:hypothetical protein